MKQQRRWSVIFLGMIMMVFAGCQETKNPTDVSATQGIQAMGQAIKLTDDSTGSPIVSQQYPAGTTVIVAIGDSITYGWGAWKGGYPAKLLPKLQAAGYNVTMINAGIPGEFSGMTDQRFLETIAGADIVLLMIGTNDIVNPKECPFAYNCNTSGHIQSMLNKAIISKVTPLVSTVIPENPYDMYISWNLQIEALNAAIRQAAATQNIGVVDNYSAVLQNGAGELYVDKHHFNEQGDEVLAQQWFNAIVQGKLIQPAR